MANITIIEVLDFGQSLLSNGMILKSDGTMITKEQYEQAQLMAQRNKLDWIDIDSEEFLSMLEHARFATKTYELIEEISGMSQSKLGFAIIDEEGNPQYLRSSEFSGAESFQFANVNYGQMIYNVDRNSTEHAFDKMTETIEDIFGTTDQVGSMFSPDSETNYNIKKFIKDNHVWSIVFRNGKLSNVKQGERLHQQAEARPKASKIADALNNNKFANLY